MYDYLVYNGVSPRQLLMESDSTSTVENIAYSKIVIEQDRMKDKKEIIPMPGKQARFLMPLHRTSRWK